MSAPDYADLELHPAGPEPEWACVYCSSEERAGPCFGPDRCMAIDPEPPSPRLDRFIVALSALTAILVIGAVWKMVTGG